MSIKVRKWHVQHGCTLHTCVCLTRRWVHEWTPESQMKNLAPIVHMYGKCGGYGLASNPVVSGHVVYMMYQVSMFLMDGRYWLRVLFSTRLVYQIKDVCYHEKGWQILIQKAFSMCMHEYEFIEPKWVMHAVRFMPVRLHNDYKSHIMSMHGQLDISIMHQNPFVSQRTPPHAFTSLRSRTVSCLGSTKPEVVT